MTALRLAVFLSAVFSFFVGCRTVPPAPGDFIKIYEHAYLHAYRTGAGTSTAIFQGGFASPSAYTDFYPLHTQLAPHLRIFAYDRAGTGWSAASPLPLTLDQATADLRAALAAAGEKPPYVLIAQSMGSLPLLHFAARHPADIAAIVLIDGASPHTYDRFEPEASIKTLQFAHRFRPLLRVAACLHLLPDLNQRARLLPAEIAEIDRALLLHTFARPAMIESANQVRPQALQLQKACALGAIPLLVISAEKSFTDPAFARFTDWRANQNELLALSTRSRQLILPSAHALIHLENADVIAKAVLAFLAEHGVVAESTAHSSFFTGKNSATRFVR